MSFNQLDRTRRKLYDTPTEKHIVKSVSSFQDIVFADGAEKIHGFLEPPHEYTPREMLGNFWNLVLSNQLL